MKEGTKDMKSDVYHSKYTGVLSDKDILEAIHNGTIYIAPFDRAQLQPADYNLTPTRFFYSTKKKRFLTVIENSDEVYVMIDKNDTVLVRTRESVAISSSLSGAFYSKVKVVSEGFGHVSTTLDPNWEGQLLISLNNPTNRKLKFSIEKNVYGKTIYNSFVTVEFMGLDSLPLRSSDNPPGRLDILDHTVEKNISIFKRKEVEELRMLLKQLHVCEERRIDLLLLNRLSPEERKVWEQIYSIDENEEFEEEIKDFLDEKKKKYLRFLQEDFYRNSVRSIEIINEYIDRKQSYIPIRKKVGTFLMRHLYRLIGVILVCILGVALVVLSVTGQKNETIWIVYSALSSCIIYIFFPIVHEIFFKEK